MNLLREADAVRLERWSAGAHPVGCRVCDAPSDATWCDTEGCLFPVCETCKTCSWHRRAVTT